MSVTYKVKGLDNFIKQVNQKPKEVEQRVSRELGRSVLRAEVRAKKYSAWDTGWMAMNIYSNMIDVLKFELVSPVYYSIFLEFGTRKMQAQPFIYPAVQDDYWILMRRLNKIIRG